MGYSIELAEQVYGDRTQVKEETKKSVVVWDWFRFLGNCPPTPPLSQRFALSEKLVLKLA